MFESIELPQHAAFISLSKTSGDVILFNSDFKNKGCVRLTISKCECFKHDSYSNYNSGEQYIVIDLTFSQFAELITSFNYPGVPCTLVRLLGNSIEQPKEIKNYKEEFEQKIDSYELTLIETIKSLIIQIESTQMKVKDKKSLLDLANKLLRELKCNVPYVLEKYKEKIEELEQKLKTEIISYIELNNLKINNILEGNNNYE